MVDKFAVMHVLSRQACCHILLLLLITGSSFASDDTALTAGVFTPARLAPDFSLAGSNGAELTVSHYRGKVILLAFGYTSCTNVCPVTLATLALVRKKLGAAADGVQVIYLTVDPERDTVERMRAFVTGFDPSFVGGTGTPQHLAKVMKDYGVTAKKVASKHGGYEVAHSSFIYMIDKQGKLWALMPFGHAVDDFVHDIKILLGQQSLPAL
jgi:protein SCO1/2